MTFLYNGAVEYDEPGVFVAFEEQPEDLIKNVGSLNYNIKKLIAEKKLAIDHVEIERSKIAESGEYDLEGLFIRLNCVKQNHVLHLSLIAGSNRPGMAEVNGEKGVGLRRAAHKLRHESDSYLNRPQPIDKGSIRKNKR